MPGATTKYAFPYPLGTDPISDGDDQIKALAERVELILAGRVVGYAQPTPGAQSIGNAFTDIAGASVTFTAAAGRRYRLHGWANIWLQTGGPGIVNLQFADGANTPLRDIAATHPAGAYLVYPLTYIVTASAAGSTTYKLQAKAPVGGLIQFNGQVHLSVEDIG